MHHVSKIHRGFANYEQNTGLIRPAALNVSASVSQKWGADDPLNNYEGALSDFDARLDLLNEKRVPARYFPTCMLQDGDGDRM